MGSRRRNSPSGFFHRTLRSLVHARTHLFRGIAIAILEPVKACKVLIRPWQRWIQRRNLSDPFKLIFVYGTLPIFKLLASCQRLFGRWNSLRKRSSPRFLLQGLPAIVVLLVMMPLVTFGSKDLRWYERAAESAYDDHDFATAELYLRAVVTKEPENEAARYRLALAIDGMADHPRASEIMNSLATLTEDGYPPAHLWIAEQLMKSDTGSAAMATAEEHLKHALHASPNLAHAHQQLGLLYLANRRLDDAEPHLLKAVDSSPALWIDVARLRVLQGKRGLAVNDAEKALEYYRTRAQNDMDDVPSRLYWAETLMFLERFDAAAAVLFDGKKFSSDPRYPQAISRLCLIWAEILRAGRRPSEPADQELLLLTSFHHNPRYVLLLRRLISGLRHDDKDDDKKLVCAVLSRIVQNERGVPSIVNLLRAIDADSRHRVDAADDYLVEARKVDPQIPAFISKLAISLMEIDQATAIDAKYLLDLGVRAWSRDPELLYARGYFYYRRGQWIDALGDFESAFPKSAERADLRKLLDDVYKRLGLQDTVRLKLEQLNAGR